MLSRQPSKDTTIPAVSRKEVLKSPGPFLFFYTRGKEVVLVTRCVSKGNRLTSLAYAAGYGSLPLPPGIKVCLGYSLLSWEHLFLLNHENYPKENFSSPAYLAETLFYQAPST